MLAISSTVVNFPILLRRSSSKTRVRAMAMESVLPAVIIGEGRVERALHGMGGGRDLLVRRGQPVPADFKGPVFVCTRNDDLEWPRELLLYDPPGTCFSMILQELGRFDAEDMLEKLRNRRLVFVGDSIGRNQWESLLCMLSYVISDKSSVYEVIGSPITKHNGFLVFKFSNYNCTVEYYRSPFLVVQGRPPAGLPDNIKTTLRLDVMDWMSSRWIDADVLIFNTGHWWNYEKTIRGGCYFQEGEEVKMEMSVETAFRRSIETLFDWINKEVDTNRTHVIFRTYAPVHFRAFGS